MSDMIKHVIVGDMLGTISAYFHNQIINNSVFAFGIGFSSHIILDYLENDYVVNWFNMNELSNALPFLIFQFIATIILLWVFIYNNRRYTSKYSQLRIIAVFGAVSPDIIDGLYSVLNPEAWYSGNLIFPWHSTQAGMQNFTMSMYTTMAITVVFIILRYLFYKYIFTKDLIYPEVKRHHIKNKEI